MPTILVVHGALGSAEQLQPVAQELAKIGTVINVELVGHGSTPVPSFANFDMEAFWHQLRAEVKRANLPENDKPYVFGYSMGGYAALALESMHPNTFAGILTLGTKFAWTPALALRECSRLDPAIIAEKVPKFAQILEQRHRDAGGWEHVLTKTGGVLARLGDSPLLTKESLARVEARVCIAVGEKDDTVSADEAREYAGFVPNGSSEVIPDAPHPIERVPVAAISQLMEKLIRPGS